MGSAVRSARGRAPRSSDLALLRTLCLALAAASLPASVAIAASHATGGESIVEHGTAAGTPACISCHGPHLMGNPAIKAPAIAGLDAAFIIGRLDHYASPQGRNPLMKQVASSLTPAQRVEVAGYIATLPRPASGHAMAGRQAAPAKGGRR